MVVIKLCWVEVSSPNIFKNLSCTTTDQTLKKTWKLILFHALHCFTLNPYFFTWQITCSALHKVQPQQTLLKCQPLYHDMCCHLAPNHDMQYVAKKLMCYDMWHCILHLSTASRGNLEGDGMKKKGQMFKDRYRWKGCFLNSSVSFIYLICWELRGVFYTYELYTIVFHLSSFL